MTVEFRVISIGALSHNRLWGEAAAVRTPHATTTLIAPGDDRRILVDPSLPASALAARFNERTGRRLGDVSDVFCTTLRPVHRRSLDALPDADWWCSPQELDAYRDHLAGLLDSADRLDGEAKGAVQADLALLDRFRPAPETFGRQVHLFPLPGASAGSAGLLLTPPTTTVVVAGDAAVTAEHLRRGQVWAGCHDTAAAMASLRDIIEIADAVVCGHDNLTVLSRAW
jgi:glyoxylase-like metal-dependent hydrolase (beta-lactamase superfamily II)